MESLFNSSVQAYLIIALIITNIITIVWLHRTSSHYNGLVKTADKKTLTKIFESIQKTISLHEKKMEDNKKDITSLSNDSKFHLQNLKLKRFNPFSDTGGDQSFILSILDANKDGVIITSLHSRENTRFYVKSVLAGKGKNHPLSDDEVKVINSKKRK